jgi:hypothetical protein
LTYYATKHQEEGGGARKVRHDQDESLIEAIHPNARDRREEDGGDEEA